MSEQWAVRVNEVRVNAVHNDSASWWFWYRRQAENAGRVTVEQQTLGGDVVTVACSTKDHAEWLIDHIHHIGVPRSALQVVRHD